MDRRFSEVVTSGQSTGHGEKERGYRALCGDCGTYHTCRRKEFGEERTLKWSRGEKKWFSVSPSVGMQHFKYVAQMRAWNCCNEGEEPLDGFPDAPDGMERYTKR